MGKLRRPSHATVVAYLALFAALGLGTAWAAVELEKNDVRSKHIAKKQVKKSDLANDAVNTKKVKNASLLGEDFAPGQLPQGPQGERGPAGSPDTPEQVRDKLVQVDGSGSGIDADQLDGIDSGGFAREVYSATLAYDPPSLAPNTCDFRSVNAPSGTVAASDTLVVSPSDADGGGLYFPLQVTPAIEGDLLHAFVCNNGGGTLNEGPLTLNFRVLR